MAAVRRESLFARHASAANKWTNRHKKARRGKSLRYRDFIRKSVGCIKIECDAGVAFRTQRHRHGPDFRRERTPHVIRARFQMWPTSISPLVCSLPRRRAETGPLIRDVSG